MVNLILKGFFQVVMTLFSIIMTPIVYLVTSLFPDLTSYFAYITRFLGTGFYYVRSLLRLLLITDNMIYAVFDYFFIIYAIYLTTLVVRFTINVYNKLKI